jgi:signal transduction histidine kinase
MNLAASSLTEAERAEYLSYERQRRRRLLSVVVPFGVILTGIAFLVATLTLIANPRQSAAVLVNDALTLLLAALFVVAWISLRRDHLGLASSLVLALGGGGILLTVAVACFSQGLTPLSLIQVASLSTVLVLVGMLGGLRTIIAAALLLSAVTVSILLLAPRPGPLDAQIGPQLPLLISVTVTYQWAVAASMIAIWATYRQTLQSLGVAFARAQRLDTLKDQFITHINHELRTPIMTLQGYIEYLQLGQSFLPPAELDAALAKAGRTADTLVTLLSNVLDIRRIEAHQDIPPAPVRVRDALDAALALIDPRYGGGALRDLRLQLPDDLTIWGDAIRLQQILTNLLSNALKYSPPGSPIAITGHVLPAAASAVLRRGPTPAARELAEISIRDYGEGIPPDQAPLLFNRFVRLPRDLASSVVGTGLGLYLCRVFAEAMGGSIAVESSGISGEGSTFILRLPTAPDVSISSHDTASAAPAASVAPIPSPVLANGRPPAAGRG